MDKNNGLPIEVNVIKIETINGISPIYITTEDMILLRIGNIEENMQLNTG